MKNVVTLALFALIFTSVFNSCKIEIPYTKDVETKYELDDEKLKGLEFHIMGSIVLSKRVSKDDTQLADGDIVVSASQNTDQVIFKAATTGLFVKQMPGNKIAVSFEKDDNHFLVFGSTSEKGIYKLQVDSANSKGGGKIKYNGEDYDVTRTSLDAYITVKMKKSSKNSTNQRVAGGRKV
ncbi:MAG: hypothetical protein ACI8Q1_003444 [Parvicella sp.]|jgi:hypothetical protein